MSTETQLDTVKKLLGSLLEGDIFLVDMKVKPINNIKIYLDADSGLGMTSELNAQKWTSLD